MSADRNIFDPDVHITAGELRRLGFYLSEMLPDRAYVRRVAVGLCATELLADGSGSVGLSVLEPFTTGRRCAQELLHA